MKFTWRIIVFIFLFSGIFYYQNSDPILSPKTLLADLGGIPWLYSSLGMLFSIIVGFVIQKQWDNWNNLLDSVKEEVGALRELWLWSKQFPDNFKKTTEDAIKDYLSVMVDDGLRKSEKGVKSEKIENSLMVFHDNMFKAIKVYPELSSMTFVTFTKILESRTNRIRYSSHHIPTPLKHTLLLGVILVISLSFFIGIKNIYLDYIYTISVSIMAFVIYLVVDDLDNPLKTGNWQVTNRDYKELLDEMNSFS